MKRRLAAFALSVAMVAVSGMTVNAASITDMAGAGTGTEITGDGEMNLPTIKITVPTTVDFVINPFQMEYTDDEGGKSSNQIICAPQEISNESNVGVAVNVTELTTKEVKDGVTISTTALTDKITAKSAFLYLEVVKDGTDFAAAYNKTATNQVVIPNAGDKVKPASKDAIVVLDKGDTTATKAKCTIGGAVVANPKVTNSDKTVSDAPWVDGDKFNVSFKFTFTPQVVAKSGS